ncbi:adenosylcobinamide amidohydrolase [Desulfonema ishimotonii]|uniref:Adenosylcobinamide amidohydrolase n=1 Tax=Desulfonema ishimotonii TaxID=45657 RepID=A0A401FZZ7_9BACT|nr:helical backbone metal receptor [Desulfonema ishimotonii]GBC62549.1 adenosylcobinamide amidohydrolase [Desulfonema ishimotonii]
MKYLYRLSAAVVVALHIFFFFGTPSPAFSYPVRFKDNDQRTITIDRRPERVVSLVPSVTELIFAIKAGDTVQGVTHHDTWPSEAALKSCVGGFFSPSVTQIRSLNPDIIFVSELHRDVIKAFDHQPVRLIRLRLDSLSDLYETIGLLGQIFHEEENASELAADIKASLNHTAQKTASIGPSEQKRVIRLMGRDQVMTPGDDSFQNQLIRLAGGIPPKLGRPGKIVPVTKAEWMAFNPQVIYGCGGDRRVAEKILSQPGWKDVEAVKNGKIFYYPCELTCRLSSRTGYFVSCLSSRIYGDLLDVSEPVIPDGVAGSRPVSVELTYVQSAEIIDSPLFDFVHKTLLVRFDKPMAVVSTLEGFRENIRCVGNSYSPPQCWGLYHRIGLAESRKRLLDVIGRGGEDTTLLFTGADMDNLSVQKQSFKEMTVYALVTAGVKSNAVRMSQDTGAYYEPGTINMILMSDMKLSPRAMNRAIISATEAKTAALWDMDIRSSATPLVNPATGTGTDNIIVVQGDGLPIDNAGGHSKMGELIAKAVYAGVREAVFKQNGITPKRTIFQRLRDRHVSLFGLVGDCECGMKKSEMASGLEQLLLDPKYAGFIEVALAISDAYERGLTSDLSAFQSWCDRIAHEVAGGPVEHQQQFSFSEPLPRVPEMAFEALLNGMAARAGKGD